MSLGCRGHSHSGCDGQAGCRGHVFSSVAADSGEGEWLSFFGERPCLTGG